MGNRANIFIQTNQRRDGVGDWDGIGIYTHWHGTQLHDRAIEALPFAAGRVGDRSYFARIITQRVLDAVSDADSETGTGLWVDYPCDNEHPILVINALTGNHWLTGENSYRRSEGS